MNLVAKIRSLQAQVDELRARLDAQAPTAGTHGYSYGRPFTIEGELNPQPFIDPLTAPIERAEPIASATIAPPPAKRRGRPPKPKV